MIGSLSMGVFCSWERWSEGLMSGTMCTRGEGGGGGGYRRGLQS